MDTALTPLKKVITRRNCVRYLLYVLIIFWVSSCKKSTTTTPVSPGFIKVFVSDSNWQAVNGFQLSDGNIYLFGVDPNYKHFPVMIKMTPSGTLIWQKSMPSQLNNLQKVIPLNTNNGFVALSDAPTPLSIFISTFNEDGVMVNSASVGSNLNISENLPLDMVTDEEGNFYVSCTSTKLYPELIIISPNLSVSNTKLYSQVSFLVKPPYYIAPAYCLAKTTSDIYIAGSNYCDSISFKIGHYPAESFIIQTNHFGDYQSFRIIDSNRNSSPVRMVITNNNQVAMFNSNVDTNNIYASDPNGTGVWVQYREYDSLRFSSGNMGYVLYNPTTTGNTWTAFPDTYSNNGLITSARPTSDGGFILTGITGQYNNTLQQSPTKMYMLKLSNGLAYEWSEEINTVSTEELASDVIPLQDGSGYLLFGSAQSSIYPQYFNLSIIKTNLTGNY
jgi:hypothetical protein